MHLLTASRLDGEIDEGIVPGELVVPGLLHDLDLARRGVFCPCGCAVRFVGLATGRGTSVAVCKDLELTADELVVQVTEAFARMWAASEIPVGDLALDLARASAEDAMLLGAGFQPGEVVYRIGPRFTARERPERGLSTPLDAP